MYVLFLPINLILMNTVMGLRRLESMERLSKCVKKPLGCCYDEIRELWAIADSHNNRACL